VGSTGVPFFPVFSGDILEVVLKDPRFVKGLLYFSTVPTSVLDAIGREVVVKIYVEICEVEGECVKFFFCWLPSGYTAHARLFGERVTVQPSATQS
jgi:hypothetical protein